MPPALLHAAVAAAAYLVGSIPFSYLVARRRGVDVRAVGSGNVGATNVMRSVGTGAGALAFFLDFAKGAAASLLALAVAGQGVAAALAAVMAVIGHMYPVWLGFRGGKGVATGAGAFLPLLPWATAAGLVAFAVVLALTRYASLGSIAGATVLAVTAFLMGGAQPVARAAAGMALLIVWKHRANIQRIAQGTESRVGSRPSA
ncbi:MAG TPA: glycerol-3-phosphate 1-O-acyltransferase PlsY [Vicinamibacteria bacterium]|jgi:glycerol-3-phosphate acyltransferase PlsY